MTEQSPPVSIMVWTLPDAVIEDPSLLEHQFDDLCRAGFDGVAVYVRCSRYTWDDPGARRALAHISRLCRKARIDIWIGPDPRFISRQLIAYGGGAELLLFGDASRAATVPNTAPVSDGRFSVRCMLSPRHAHMFHEVALEYTPLAVCRCYAVRNAPGPLRAHDVRDITSAAHCFYNARDRYVEAFGMFTPPAGEQWDVVAFFHVASTHVDYSNRRQMARYARQLKELRAARVDAGSVMWDEPGYTCTYGSLPFTPAIRAAYRRTARSPLERSLWKLAYDAVDGSHVPVRVDYYRVVQDSVNNAQRFTNRVMRQLWKPDAIASVHDTWHFESADMCDMNHGSMDLWRASRVKSGGFVDLGAVCKLREPSDPYYAHLAALSVINTSLGRHSKGKFAYNNLWTEGDDDGAGWQRTVLDHCVNVMALFGNRWLAHAYGPVGTIGAESSFLGSPPLPGYPAHSTWPGFPEWNERLRSHFTAVEGKLPETNLLMIFPVETMYAFADTRADRAAADIFRLILALVDAHYQVDVISTAMAAKGRWHNDRFMLDGTSYESLILPCAEVIEHELARRLKDASGRVILYGSSPSLAASGKKIKNTFPPAVRDTEELLGRLEKLKIARPVNVPAGTWVTTTHISRGTLLSMTPARHGCSYEGPAGDGTTSLEIPRSSGLTRVLFPAHGAARIV